MERKIALLVVYNHRYDRNIPIIDELYKDRFSYIYHLVPFYDGNRDNVITVYDCSFYFQNYIAQAYQHLKTKGFTHFFIVADDMMLRPSVNEKNVIEEIGINENDCYISRLTIFQERKDYWYFTPEALIYKVKQPGVEIENIIPSCEEAKKSFDHHGYPYTKIPLKRFFSTNWNTFKTRVWPYRNCSRTLDYPLIGGYSDILCIPAEIMPRFCQICGAFAATKLFVEIAIPTALALSSKSIKTDVDLGIKRGDWDINVINELTKDFNFELNKLHSNFPNGFLYLHPIKLSKWK